MESTAARIGAAAGAGCLAFLVLAAAAATAVLSTLTGGLFDFFGGGAGAGPSAPADIPPRMLALYQQAAPTCPGLPWTVLAAIGKIETDHGRVPNQVSTAGAVGPMQFLPGTFDQYTTPVPPGGATPPTPWDPVDAAARLLCANGARDGLDLHAAIYAYNHADWYVDEVLTQARAYAKDARLQAEAVLPPNQTTATTIAYARSKIGTPYEWGGTGTPGHGYDCSGLTQAAYAAAGVNLPRVAQDQYNATLKLPSTAPLLPGDLLFYGADLTNITHVGLYTGDGQMIDAAHTGTPVRTEPARHPDDHYLAATRPAP
ncbi:bifunctional lytic transglycosylase/C40 family peptidase [Kitasatospora sp. NBC_01287]|uniref:C40 family peptidase n=1 Tax=Kitasatospora sp. NBC_01287 TaxID=2903573 RepID=UPI00225A37EE|nr:bifunctional lytic transglycosylase/C40 family peptidase [Kitasatospora sp. NBC_01287]MCX4750595.1 bifunctional lytic transglycosylase/C40 family peptidase [Kitasatospora sp. NBC_01287]